MKRSELPKHAKPGADLKPGERDLLRLLCKGRPYKAIAETLGISMNVVTYRLQCVLAKLGARNATEAAFIAGRDGMVQ